MKTLKRRRLENKTNYSKRIKLLKGKTPRIVFRKTNRYLIAQYVTSKNAQDKIEFGSSTSNLVKYGWPKEFENSLKSIPAAYLLGTLMAKEISSRKLENPIVDFGMLRTEHKSRVFAFLKGLIDSGIKMNCSKDNFPSEERIKGKHLKKDFTSNFEKIKLAMEKK